MAETVGTYSAMLKEFYTDEKVENLVLSNSPALAMFPKNTKIEGEVWDIPLVYGDPAAGSALFATGQSHKGNTKTTKFQVTMQDDYSFAAISRKVMLASRS